MIVLWALIGRIINLMMAKMKGIDSCATMADVPACLRGLPVPRESEILAWNRKTAAEINRIAA